MVQDVNEALLEMYFYKPLVDFFKSYYGIDEMTIHKPSQQEEVYVGYDQAWVKTKMSNIDLFNKLKNSIKNNNTKINKFYLGFFLQFKKVKKMKRNSKYKPYNYSLPYYRSEISLTTSEKTEFCQHHTLKRLSEIKNTSVAYACGMVFNSSDVLLEPNLSKLRIVPVNNAPYYKNNEKRHFITFQRPFDLKPLYKSEPVISKSYSVEEWVKGDTEFSPKKMTAEETLGLLNITENKIKKVEKQKDYYDKNYEMTNKYYNLTILECIIIDN